LFYHKHKKDKKMNAAKIAVYIFFIIIIFGITLIFMPYEFFFFSAIIVLFALKEIEKEIMQFKKS